MNSPQLNRHKVSIIRMQRIVLLVLVITISNVCWGQSASFTYSSLSGSFCNPDTIKFTATASGSPQGYIWNFGNGKGSSKSSPLTVYKSAGIYKVKLTVIYSSGTVEVTNDVVINAAVSANFTGDNLQLCKPGVVNFTASAGGQSYSWDFGDGGTSVTDTGIVSHNFADYGSYSVTLSVSSPGGCSRSSSQVVDVTAPVLTGTVSATEGCIPANIGFTASTTTLPGDAVSGYQWQFGDGTSSTSVGGNSSHSYSAVGEYSPKVVVTTVNGCSSTFDLGTIAFGIPPTNLVAYTPIPVVCGSERPKFIGKADNANFYIWDNTESVDVVDDTVTSHKFGSLGTKTIVVTPSYNGCLGSSDSFQIKIIGVIAKFNYNNTCRDKNTFDFASTSLGNKSTYNWNFDDQSLNESAPFVQHTFSTQGTFNVALAIFDSTTLCADTSQVKIFTASPSLTATDLSVCRQSTIKFEIENDYSSKTATHTWNLVGKKYSSNSSEFSVIADKLGNFQNSVVIRVNGRYCPDTIFANQIVKVKGPSLGFTYNDSFCLNTPLTVKNLSKPFDPADAINLWVWNFGDGDRDSIYQPGPHEYSLDGNFRVSLSATDINGCSDILRKTVHTSEEAFVYTFPKIDTLCLGESDTLIAFQSDSVSWSPGTGMSCTTCDTTLVSPSNDITYYATSTNPFGCSATDSVLVKVYNPFTATTSTPDVYICLNDSALINAGPPNYSVTWSPALNISDPASLNPYVYPGNSTTYTATLQDSVGCFTSTVDVNVHIKSLPSVDAGPDAYYEYNSPFTITPAYGSNVVSYLWSPANQLNCSACADPSGTILKKQTFTVEVRSDSGCVSRDSVTIFVICKESNLLLPNAFTPNGDNLNDFFYPIARGYDKILNFSIYSREGRVVYQQKDFAPNDKTKGWNGEIRGGAQTSTAVFVYTIDALCDSGEIVHKKGSVVVIR